MLFYTQSIETLYKNLHTTTEGLSQREALKRRQTYGPNSLNIQKESIWKTLVEPFRNIFMLVLFIAALVSFLHAAIFDGVIILSIMLISAIIYYVQKFSTDRILRSLQKHTVQKVEVVRSGKRMNIEVADLVPGDVVVLSEGDKIPADIRLTVADALRADESVLTGESVPVAKHAATLSKHKEVYEQTNMLFQGAFVVSGSATGVVVATGNETEFGKIAALSTQAADAVVSPVQKKIDKLLSLIVAAVGALAIIAFGIALLRGIELTEALLFVLAISVSAVPESLPVAISVILVLGMRRMAAKKALVRSMRAIETIGVITTIATDKTGTLTENKLSVQEAWQPKDSQFHLPSVAHHSINAHGSSKDPLDIAMIDFTEAEEVVALSGVATAKLPFNQDFSMSGNVWQHKGAYQLYLKGAPEAIMARSGLSGSALTEAEAALQHLTGMGYRVIALGHATLQKSIATFEEMTAKESVSFVGFLAVADTLRPTARRAIKVAQRAEVTVRMITGDHFETAFHIGRQLGLVKGREEVFDSRQMNDLNDAQLTQKVVHAKVFSRVTPENKYRILQILKTKEVAAMTGDGVNDVPALASAHVGIAMGSGSSIAKDAGDIILLNNNFEGIVQAMREGRIIFSNIRRMLFYLLSTNTGEVVTMVTAIAIGLPAPLLPVQILWANLVTDTSMVIPLGLEPGEKDTMQQKPIKPDSPLLSKYIISRIALVAVTMAILALSLYSHYGNLYDFAYAQTITFAALIGMQWANAFSARSTLQSVFTRIKVFSKAFYIGLSASVVLQCLALFGPLQSFLGITPVRFTDLALSGVLVFTAMITVVEIHKFFGRRYLKDVSN